MSVFDITSTAGASVQSAATTVANSLVPKHHASAAHSVGAAKSGTVHPQASAAGTAANTNSTITSNDFLTLLVSELKNQDPTQPTDPNAYITQLVGVNSLQQLISINQGINGTAS